jgi:prepilin-type N-terminal cleavage/methylation domain-containing protein
MRTHRGFTLLELLVAVGITLLLAGLLLTATTNLLQGWRRAQGAATLTVEAKLVLDQLERDFQAAIFRTDGKNWFDARILEGNQYANNGWLLTAAGVLKPEAESLRPLPPAQPGMGPSIVDARFGRSGMWLRLVTSDYDSSAGNVPAAVSYQVVRRRIATSTDSPIRYALFRAKLAADQTFTELGGNIFTTSTPTGLNAPTNSDVIATNVIDFGFWLSSRNPNGQETVVYPANNSSTSVSASPARPVMLAMVRILTEEGAAIIDAIESGRIIPPAGRSPGEWWWETAEANSRVFVRKIEAKGPLP